MARPQLGRPLQVRLRRQPFQLPHPRPTQVQPGFAVSKAWRDEFYNRLVTQGVKVDRAQFDAGGTEIDRLLGSSIARIAFGDSTEKRRDIADDSQLRRAIELIKNRQTQRDLFAAVAQDQVNTASTSH